MVSKEERVEKIVNQLEIIGIIVLLIIVIAGVTIKLYTMRKLSEIDGMSEVYTCDDNEKEQIVARF